MENFLLLVDDEEFPRLLSITNKFSSGKFQLKFFISLFLPMSFDIEF